MDETQPAGVQLLERETESSETIQDWLAELPQNPWEHALTQQNIEFNVPERYLDTWYMPPGTHIDPLTGLPIEEDEIRIQVAQAFSDAIRNNKGWAIISCDVDNLKLANTKLGREFGDMVIRYGASLATTFIESLGLSEQVVRYALRQTSAADETMIYLFNLTPEELQELQKKSLELDQRVSLQYPAFTLSQTSAVITSDNQDLQPQINADRQFLHENDKNISFNTFNYVKQRADEEIKLRKIAKDVERLPIELLMNSDNNTERIKELLIENLGDSRISSRLLEKMYEIVTFETHLRYRRPFGTNLDQYRAFLQTVGVDEDMLGLLTHENPRINFYTNLLKERADSQMDGPHENEQNPER